MKAVILCGSMRAVEYLTHPVKRPPVTISPNAVLCPNKSANDFSFFFFLFLILIIFLLLFGKTTNLFVKKII